MKYDFFEYFTDDGAFVKINDFLPNTKIKKGTKIMAYKKGNGIDVTNSIFNDERVKWASE